MRKSFLLSSWSLSFWRGRAPIESAAIGSILTALCLGFVLTACDDSSSASSDETGVSSSSVESPDSSVTLSGALAESNGSSDENMEKDKSSSSFKGSEPADVSSSSAKETKTSSDSKSSSSVKSGDSSSSSSAGKVNCSALLEGETGWNWDVSKECRFNPDIDYGSMTDERDGKVYRTVTIGDQVWMAENLNYADSVKTPSLKRRNWCYNNVAANCDVTGRLYTWAAAMDSVKTGCGYENCSPTLPAQGVCPPNWHLPTYAEWNVLFNQLRARYSSRRADGIATVTARMLSGSVPCPPATGSPMANSTMVAATCASGVQQSTIPATRTACAWTTSTRKRRIRASAIRATGTLSVASRTLTKSPKVSL